MGNQLNNAGEWFKRNWRNDTEEDTTNLYTAETLTRHMYVCGLSGSGKSTFVQNLLIEMSHGDQGVPFLVLEPTRSQQYRKLQTQCKNRKFHTYTLGINEGNKMDLNPFYIPFGMDFTGHIELLKSCFSDALTCKEPLVYQYLERAIPEVYFDKGWDRITFTHPHLLSKDDYQSEEHWFYFPRMQDLYNKVVELSEKSEFTEGSENKGTIRELVKSNLRTFLSGPMGRSFNTYRNELYSVIKHNVVIEIPNTISTTLQAILNLLLGIVIEVIGSRKKSEKLSHITVFEEAQLLFNAEDDDKINKTTARKLEYLLSTSRKFGESIIIVNQDPKAIHRSVIGNIRQRIIYQVNYSDIVENMAKDFEIDSKLLLRYDENYQCWAQKNGSNAKQWGMTVDDKADKAPDIHIEHNTFTTEDYLISCSGLDNFNEQLAGFDTFVYNCSIDQVQAKESLKTYVKAQLQKLCNIDKLDIDEYLAYLTCIYLSNNKCKLPDGLKLQMKSYFASPDWSLPKSFSNSGIIEKVGQKFNRQ